MLLLLTSTKAQELVWVYETLGNQTVQGLRIEIQDRIQHKLEQPGEPRAAKTPKSYRYSRKGQGLQKPGAGFQLADMAYLPEEIKNPYSQDVCGSNQSNHGRTPAKAR